MKQIILTFLILTSTAFVFSQDINIKKNIVIIDGKECLKISGDGNNVSFSDMDGNELFFLKFIHNSKYGRLYNKITFLDQKLSFTSMSYIFTKKLLIKKLFADGTLSDCKLKAEKVEKFVLKYDESVEKP